MCHLLSLPLTRGSKIPHMYNLKYYIMVNKFQTYIRLKTRSMIIENFTPAECAKIFDVEYRNMCAYIRGSKVIPLNLCFDILEYLGAKVVIFKGM